MKTENWWRNMTLSNKPRQGVKLMKEGASIDVCCEVEGRFE